MTSELAELTTAALTGELDEQHEAVRKLAEPLAEVELWAKPIVPGNSIGHLILHLTGNLNHYIGAHLGSTGYRRDREREFTEEKHPTKEMLLANLAEAVKMFHRVVGGLSSQQLAATYPEGRYGSVVTAVTHMVAHFALHRGQMSYLARLVGSER
jgi:uncharacterized damage-inducible protein DinB